jgi:hypothetical protein
MSEDMIQGIINSFGFKRAESSRTFNVALHNALAGWNVMFRFLCPCGVWHSGSTKNAWRDTQTDIVNYACPTISKVLEVEITKPRG